MKTLKIIIICLILMPILASASVLGSFGIVKDSTSKTIIQYYLHDLFLLRGEKVPYSFSHDHQLKTVDGFVNGGLLNIEEYKIAGSVKSYLYDGAEYWTMTSDNEKMYAIFNNTDGYKSMVLDSTNAYRLTQIVRKGTKVTGTGTYNDPWIFSGRMPILSIDLDGGVFKSFNEEARCSIENYEYCLEMNVNDIVRIPVPIKEKYDLKDWIVEKNESDEESLLTKNADKSNDFKIGIYDVSIKANWIEAKYKLTYDLDGGRFSNGVPNEYIIYAGDTHQTPIPTKEDYSFEGWSFESVEGSKLEGTTFTMGHANQVLKAKWKARITGKYNLTYNLDGGNFKPGVKTKYELKTGDTHRIPIPTKENYVISGWQLKYDNGAILGESTFTMGYGDQELTAIWKPGKSFPSSNCTKYVVANSGNYGIELWGGDSREVNGGYVAKGGYTYGEIYLEKGQELYFCVGDGGAKGNTNASGSFNGGAEGGLICLNIQNLGGHSDNGGGGGATDVRLKISDDVLDVDSLKTRIMVAGGGGGSNVHCKFSSPPGTCGSAGGGLSTNGAGQSSNSGYSLGIGEPGDGGENRGTKDCGYHGSGGGGGGYFGGKSIDDYNGWPAGAGGSSYISGHAGCKKYDNKYIFTNIKMIDGDGSDWPSNSRSKGEKVELPTNPNLVSLGGHAGAARIIFLDD